MGRTGSHRVKSLDITRISVPFRIKPGLIERGPVGGRDSQLPQMATAQIPVILTDVTHLEFFDALDFIWIVGHDRVNPLAVAVTKNLLRDVCTWLRSWRG